MVQRFNLGLAKILIQYDNIFFRKHGFLECNALHCFTYSRNARWYQDEEYDFSLKQQEVLYCIY